MNAEDNITHTLKLLQGAIRASGKTQTEVDDEIGRRRGYLSHVFQRRVDLKLVDLLRALDVLGLEPRRFFAAVVDRRRGGSSGVLHLLAGPEGDSAAGEELQEPLEERIRQAVREILTELRS